ncbi:MAG TPA: hypothetical protein VFP84_16250 [Kofleriaceae bacterium]|nr:hypothetical protein [Kofleriaceae bacterium]
MEALDTYRLEAVGVEALANAANDAATRLPFPADARQRQIFDRLYVLVVKAADAAAALVARGDEIIDEFTAQIEEQEAAPVSES